MKHPIANLLLIASNITYCLLGLTVMIAGIIGLVNFELLVSILQYTYVYNQVRGVLYFGYITSPLAIYLTCLGSVAFLLSLLGCAAGYMMEQKWLLFFYGFFKVSLILFNLSVVIYNAVSPFWMANNIRGMMMRDLQNYNNDPLIPIDPNFLNTNIEEQSAWSNMQYEQACCGIDSFYDYGYWASNYWYVEINNVTVRAYVPPSCCLRHSLDGLNNGLPQSVDAFVDLENCVAVSYGNTDKNPRGCLNYVLETIAEFNYWFIIAAAVFIALEVISFSLSLIVQAGKKDKEISVTSAE